jgi:hypothetical protein
MRKIICLLVSISFIFILGSCSLIGNGSTKTSEPVSSGYPNSVVYKIKLSNETYLCASFDISSTDAGISLLLKDVYSMVSDGKITWIGQEKTVPVVTIEKILK